MARGDKKSKEKSAEQGRRRPREPDDNGELTELPDLGPARHFEQIVHEIVWRVGRALGFQTFNYNPVTRNNQMREWVPATVFVASDHLMKVIVRNQYLREGKKGDMDPSERFARAVWEIHSTIFLNYHNRWTKHVGLAARSKALTDICLKGSFKDDAVVSGLLHELALWMLIYSEGANLRHCPEALWFYYWLCMTSSHFEEAVRQGMPEIEDDFNIREYRVHWRNANQAIIEQMQTAVHGCSGMLLEQIPHRELLGKMNEAGSIVHRELRNAGHNANRAVLRIATDLVCMGDGGHYTNTVLQPVFDVFSYEIHYLGVMNAVENSHRLGYDDVNESLTRKDVVYKFLKQVGVDSSKARSGATNSGLDKLIEKGGNYHEFDHLKVMKWYREKIFAKTFIERRSVLAIFRAFFRNYSFHILAVHLQFAIAFGDTYDNEDPTNTLKQISWSSHAAGVAVTHAFLQAFERTANAFLTRQKKNPFQQRAKDEEWMFKNDYGKKKKKKTKDGDVEGVTPRKQQNPIQVQKSTDERPTVHIEGAPIAGGWLGGSLEYWFLAIGMLVAYLLGSAQLGEMKALIDFWPYIGGGYMALVIFHEVVTTRDGYQVGLTSMLRLPMGPWTAKAMPESYLYEPMRTGWKTFYWNMFYWILVFAIKFPFDYFLIIKPLVRPLEALRTREWLSTCPASVIRAEPGVDHFWKKDTKSELFGVELGIRCIDADYVLLVARIIPFFLVTIVDTAVAHQLVMAVFGYFLGIWRLNLGLVSTWEDVIKEFHRAPALWWDRAMSREGRRNQEIWTQLNYSADVEKQKKSKKNKGDKEHTMFKELFDPTNRARWNAFGSAWDSIVDDLREADIISNEEQTNLKFVYLGGTKGSMRPILLPSFFYAGQIQNVIDTGIVSDGQRVVLQEFKALCAELLAWIGILTQEQADEVKKVELLNAPIDQAHRLSRRQLFSSAKGLVKAMTAITTLNETSDASRRREAYRLVMQNMKEVVQEVKVECRAVNKAAEKKKAKVTRGAVEASRKLMDVLKNTEAQFISSDGHVPSELAAALQQLERGGGDMSAISMASEVEMQVPSAVVHKVLGVIKDMLVKTRKEASPDANEAKRILSFFMSSLNNPELPQPTTLSDMLSHTVLTPVYQEDILYPFDGQEACQKIFGMQATPDLVDLMTETEDKVSLMSYLRSVFPKDWENFKERLGDRINTKCDRVTEYDFKTGAPLDRWQLELQLWASNRGQLLGRTIRGMMMFDKAIRTLASLEHPRPLNMAESAWNKRIDELADAKFSYVCSCQTYGKNRVDKKASRHRWLAEAVETLMQVYPRLNVAFLDFNETERGRTNYSVMACGKPLREGFESENVLDRADRYLEVYRVRLPVHTYSDSGAIVGEGKPENQNHAVIFAHGEALQAIDMNQDNHLAEAVKQRNLLSELRVDLEIEHKKRFEDLQKKFPSSAKDAHKKLLSLKTSVQPVALVGHREWIFSDKSGALGSFAASAEFAFGTIVQRITWWPGSSRMHYGHPDVFYKLYSMTRGGMSKATKTLHISEDVFGGLNHTLRGAKFKYREYIQVGKGRDMGFDAINAFEIKISGGNGEVCISRDIHRMGTRMDFFRMMAFYHSGTGYFINILLLMWSVLAQLWAITFFAMAEAGTLARPTDCPEGKTQPECDDLRDAQCGEFNLRDEAGERLVGQDCFDRLAELAAQADSLEERLNYGLYELDNTMKAENLIQIGTLSIMPYVAELLLEYGFFSTLGTLLYQFVGGSFAFFVFKQQTTTAFFWDDIIYGGALYIGTGRGFSYKAESFIKVFTNYSRSHLYFAAELFVLLIVLRAAASSAEYGNYGATTWGIWLVCVSLLISPFWFNPMMFSTSKIIRDFKAFKAWILRGELDPGTGSTWFSWNEKKLTKHRNERRNQTDHWLNIMRDGWFGALPAALMALAAVSRMNIEISQLPDALNSKYIVFLLASGFLWAFLLVVMKMRGSYKSQALTRSWRLMKTGLMVMVIVVLAFYVAVIINLSSTKSAGEIFLVLYANYNIVLIVHRIMLYHSIDDPSYRSIVDAGYRFVDIIIGFTMLSVLFVLSLGGLVSRIQAFLLFNVSFAKSVRRGKLVRTIGQSKEEPGLDEDQSRYLMGNRRRQAVAGSSNTAMRV